MTTAPDRIAVIALQLARTDRRALSQAWYDALHHAQSEPAAGAVRGARPPDAERDEAAHASPRRTRTPAASLARARGVRTRDGGAARIANERRAAPDTTARRIARAVAALGPARRATARTVALDAGRVTLLVRTDGGVTRVVAVCAAAERERIARALAHVRYVLAGAGVTVAA